MNNNQDIIFAPFLYLNNNDCSKFNLNNINNNNNIKIEGYKLIKNKLISDNNIEYIQKKLIDIVYQKTNGKIIIPKQNKVHLILIITDIYETHSKNLNYDIDIQVNDLNNQVINYCLDSIKIEINSYLRYLNDSSSPYTNLDRPMNVNKNNRNLPTQFQDPSFYQN